MTKLLTLRKQDRCTKGRKKERSHAAAHSYLKKKNNNKTLVHKLGEIHALVVKAERKGLHRPGKGYTRISSNQTIL